MQIKDILTEKRLHELNNRVSEITPQQLHQKMQNGEIFHLIEVSDPDDFRNGHIESAINIPLSFLKESATEKFKRFQQLVVYCQESNSSVGAVAARQLGRAGFSNVLLLKGGKEMWQNAGLSLVNKSDNSGDD